MKKLSILEVKLKGFPRARFQEEEIEFRTTKSQALFIYLCVESLIHPERKIAREKLSDLLWPGMPLGSALQNLRQCIYQTRKSLPKPQPEEGEDIEWIISDRKTLSINPKAPLVVDIAPYLSEAPQSSFSYPNYPESPFTLLDNFYVPDSEAFDAWVENLRHLVHRKQINHLSKQIEHLKIQKQWASIPPLAETLIRLEPLHEPYYQFLMEAQIQNQQSAEAQKTLQDLEQVLKEELGSQVSEASRAILQKDPTLRLKPPPRTPHSSSPQNQSGKRIQWAGMAALLLLVLSFIAWQVWQNQQAPLAATSPYSLAVLTFETDNVAEYIVNGLSEAVTEQLFKVKGLMVISPQSIARYRKTQKAPREIGEELGVGYLLIGNVSQAQGSIQAQVSLMQTSNGKTLWSQNFEHPIRDIFQFPSEIAQQTTEQLGVSSLRLSFPKPKMYTPKSEAYDWYLRGRQAFYQVYPDSLRQAINCFRRALTIDPNFTMARVQLAWTYCTLAGSWGDAQVEDVYIEAQMHLEAIHQNEAHQDMYHVISAFLNLWTLDKVNAAREFQKAVSVNPNIDFGYGGLSLMFTLLGRYEEAKEMAYKSLELNPHFFWNKFCLADAHFFAGEFAEAERLSRETIAVNPNHFSSIAILSRSLAAQGKYEEAIQVLSPIEEKSPYAKGQLGIVYFHAGQMQKALKIRTEMEKRHELGQKRQAYYIAMLYNLMGEPQKALDWLHISLENLENQLNWLEIDHEFRSLHDMPRFQKLLQEIPKAFPKKQTG